MKKKNPNDLTLRNLHAANKRLQKAICKLSAAQVKDYNRLWLMIDGLKKKLARRK